MKKKWKKITYTKKKKKKKKPGKIMHIFLHNYHSTS